MIVLGIDPGTASTGFGVVSSDGSQLRALAAGVIETPPGVALERRLADIHAGIGELIERHHVDGVALEELYFGANADDRDQETAGQRQPLLVALLAKLDDEPTGDEAGSESAEVAADRNST
ncbi:MAG TPA: crossover junction endodeoxyribonuclease RuvC, partial [Solirubrobacteraceae bacterium]